MKLLAISLCKDEQAGIQIRHRFFDVEKETPTCYKIKTTPKGAELLNNRTQIRKDEIDKLIINNTLERRNCWDCTFNHVTCICAWVLIEGDEPNYDLLRYWRKCIKEKALEELKTRNQLLKSMYYEISEL